MNTREKPLSPRPINERGGDSSSSETAACDSEENWTDECAPGAQADPFPKAGLETHESSAEVSKPDRPDAQHEDASAPASAPKSPDRPLHVYTRKIHEEQRNSLTVLAGRIDRGATVLDLGTGSGALGKYLSERKGCTLDGVTYNAAEARIAAPHYRSIVVADLGQCDLPALFSGQRYDYIVCADVLEHLPAPERVVRSCRELLGCEGRLLVSVPNTAYAGLIAELIEGEFRYREEGLLDATHVRHFTRRTLLRFIEEAGYVPEAIEPITLALPDSEFRAAFDALPPAVARHLLAAADALSYQFIVVARDAAGAPAAENPSIDSAPLSPPAAALFSAQLFFGRDGEYSEDAKQVAAGEIGLERQTLSFALPEARQRITSLRFDPADRPGFLHLHEMRLFGADGTLHWHWSSRQTGGVAAFAHARRSQMLLEPPWPLAGAALVALLHGDDPWVELPIPETALRASARGRLEVDLGWPMSADYLALSGSAQKLIGRVAEVEAEAQRRLAQAQADAAQRFAETQAESARELTEQRERFEREAANRLAAAERASARRDAELAAQRERAARRMRAARQRATSSARQLDEKWNELAQLERTVRQQALARARLERQLERLGLRSQELRGRYDALLNRFQLASRERDAAVQHIDWIMNSTVFRATRPAVRAKMALERALRPRGGNPGAQPQPSSPTLPIARSAYPVDVIVPVYRGLADTRLCIESVLASRCDTRWRLVVINDASPESEVTDYLRRVAALDERVVLLENEQNLGFVGTVNRGMALSETNDVLLLNSDTEVANDWLDRLRAAAYSDALVASVTPFSNNATICSYPRFCEDNELPPGWDTARLDALFARTNAGQSVEVPTGIGFCMYVRRDCLDAVGLFDVENFGKGYGEENDFCQRALNAGWRNLHALDTFVMHSGGVSFGDSKSPREQAAMQTLRRLHPSYETQVHAFLARDPAQLARLSVDLARVSEQRLPAVLAVLHDRGGGTVRHVQELAAHLQDQAVFLVLRPNGGGSTLLELARKDEGFALSFQLPAEFEALVAALRALDVQLIHYHHLLAHGELVLDLPRRLGVPYDFTLHDFFTVCPQITFTYAAEPGNRYCGELGDAQCNRCLARSPAPGGLDIETWRGRHGDFLHGARHVLAPSRAAARHVARYVPQAAFHVAPHTDLDGVVLREPQPARRDATAPLKVVVIGALSPIKGADLLEDVATAAARAGAPIDFHLIGFAYRSLRTQPRARLTVHGEYREEDLPGLLEWLKPDLAWFPAIWPETYSYTLSACLEAGLPIAAPDLGAFAERLAGRAWSWVLPWDQTPAQWLAFFEQVRLRNFVEGRAPPKPGRLTLVDGDDLLAADDWCYRRDYLEGLEGGRPSGEGAGGAVLQQPDELPPLLGRDFLAAHLPGRATGGLPAQVARGIKGRLLHSALRLRAMPVVGRMARTIPLRWQTRFKTWLRA